MTISVHGVRTVPKAASVRVALVTSDSVEAGIDGFDAGHLQMAGFEGKADQVYQQPAGGRIEALVGVGSADSVDARAVRRSAATAARSFGRHERIALRLPSGAGIAPAAVLMTQAMSAETRATSSIALYGAIVDATGFNTTMDGSDGSGVHPVVAAATKAAATTVLRVIRGSRGTTASTLPPCTARRWRAPRTPGFPLSAGSDIRPCVRRTVLEVETCNARCR